MRITSILYQESTFLAHYNFFNWGLAHSLPTAFHILIGRDDKSGLISARDSLKFEINGKK
jgi:hypothetical protein